MKEDAASLYKEREKSVTDAISLKKPDRVPIVSATELFFVRSAGLTIAEAMYDYEKMAEAWKTSMRRDNWDMAPLKTGVPESPGSPAV